MVRVISGEARGARLKTPKGDRTRPTADRVKESLFNMLGDVKDANVLDLFAGTGGLGIEALSRGAKFAAFVEADRRVASLIESNLEHTKLAHKAVVVRAAAPCEPKLIAAYGPFDLIFADPPYDRGLVRSALEWLDVHAVLCDGAVIALERRRTEELPKGLKNITSVREKVYGDTVLNLLTYRKMPGLQHTPRRG